MQDASGYVGNPDREFAPATPEELTAILAEANASSTPVTIAGSATGVTGGCCPESGWLVSMRHFDRVVIERWRALAGAAVTLRDLNTAAARTGQFYAPDPTEWTASVGGSIATNASGSRSFKYGSTRRHILSLDVAFADGTRRHFRRGEAIDFEVPAIPLPNTTKNTAGYPLSPGMDWIDLIAGSEGTLAVILEAELQLLPVPPVIAAAVLFFESDDDAFASVEICRTEPSLRMLEYLDGNSLRLLGESAAAALIVESTSEEWLHSLDLPGLREDSWVAATPQDRERFRAFRHSLPEKVNDLVRRNGFQKLGSDFAVPLDRNREMLDHYHAELSRHFPGQYVLFGHIGDAHLHANIVPATAEQDAAGRQLMLALADHAVSLGGTVSAEHGLGKRKANLLLRQFSTQSVESMLAVKRRLDPANILGRGNLFPQ
ncbi:MAG: FAD-binding oxidoreductase [Acidobacteriota bacterium]